jgi:DNA helicase-2/ATP-dependent DNA helicase PcrA
VGDDDQSIYRFRGAEVRNILDFPRQFSRHKDYQTGGELRSTPQILQIAHCRRLQQHGQVGKGTVDPLPKGEKGP